MATKELAQNMEQTQQRMRQLLESLEHGTQQTDDLREQLAERLNALKGHSQSVHQALSELSELVEPSDSESLFRTAEESMGQSSESLDEWKEQFETDSQNNRSNLESAQQDVHAANESCDAIESTLPPAFESIKCHPPI